jgi:hypothetical protein
MRALVSEACDSITQIGRIIFPGRRMVPPHIIMRWYEADSARKWLADHSDGGGWRRRSMSERR